MTPELLREQRLCRRGGRPIKVLARGDVSKALTMRAHKFSGKAAEKVKAAGGSDGADRVGGLIVKSMDRIWP